MRNQGIIIFLTIIVTLLCLYYLSFTFVASKVQQRAVVPRQKCQWHRELWEKAVLFGLCLEPTRVQPFWC